MKKLDLDSSHFRTLPLDWIYPHGSFYSTGAQNVSWFVISLEVPLLLTNVTPFYKSALQTEQGGPTSGSEYLLWLMTKAMA